MARNSDDWPLDRLGEQARVEIEKLTYKIDVVTHYWMLGVLMRMAKPEIKHGRWKDWLASHGIDRARAHRARRLAETFDSIEELRGLSLREAMRQADKAHRTKVKEKRARR